MLVRRDRGSLWPEPFDRALDWTTSPFETFRQFLDTDVKVEEFIEEGQLVVRVELPGVDPERDVDISIVDGNLQIRAERRQEEKVEHRNYRRSEIRYGSFSRVLPLPVKTKEDDIKASYHDGILEVRAPIDNSTAKPSKIPISRD
ncbi:MAG: Hsp20/alpha crystallin family protein [Acidimicrobiaceae bacterium]|nr:Hsp20/alpha crystallin family protein [Acidimicrobiaceae bacterium]